jgi:hypothetical protein
MIQTTKKMAISVATLGLVACAKQAKAPLSAHQAHGYEKNVGETEVEVGRLGAIYKQADGYFVLRSRSNGENLETAQSIELMRTDGGATPLRNLFQICKPGECYVAKIDAVTNTLVRYTNLPKSKVKAVLLHVAETDKFFMYTYNDPRAPYATLLALVDNGTWSGDYLEAMRADLIYKWTKFQSQNLFVGGANDYYGHTKPPYLHKDYKGSGMYGLTVGTWYIRFPAPYDSPDRYVSTNTGYHFDAQAR